jgi:fluoroquinolone transport system permease protein
MSRLVSTVRHDFRMQLRYGLIHAGVFTTIVWVCALVPFGVETRRALLPPLLLVNLCVTTYYFVAGLVLFEKSEDTLQALVVTPLRPWQYLAGKAAALSILAGAEGLIIVAASLGPSVALRVAPGLLLLAVLYTLCGVVTIVRYRSLTDFLVPSFLWTTLLQLPVLDYAGISPGAHYYLLPLHAPFVVVQSGFGLRSPLETAIAAGISIAWIVVFFAWAKRAFERFVVGARS